MKLSDLEHACGADAVQPWSEFARDRPSAAWLRPDTPVARPASVDAAREVLRLAAAERLRVLPIGAGTHVVLVAGVQADIVLSMRGIDSILEYEPGDATLVAEAGTSLHAIAAQASRHGQGLGPDPWPGSGTLGGAVAANRCGLGRLRRGAWRDAVLGAQVLHADGTATRTGGKVVKNVTGYDLAKLYVGSRGSLVVLAQVNVRLVPAPETTACVRLDVPAPANAAALDAELAALRRCPDLDPSAILVVCGSVPDVPAATSGTFVLVRFEGREPVVRVQAESCAQRLRGHVLAAAAAVSIYDALRRSVEPGPASDVVLRVSTLPAQVSGCAQDAAGFGAFAIAQVGVGTVHVRASASNLEALAAWARERAATGDAVAVEYGSDAELARIGAVAAVPAPELQSAMKHVFDPHGMLPPALLGAHG